MPLDDYIVVHDTERAAGQGILQESASKNSELGTELVLNDGRKFRYCLNDSSIALEAGQVVQSRGWVSTHESLATANAAKGANQVTITNGITNAITANQYTDGYLCIEITGGDEVSIYKIKSHPAAIASATCVITLYDPLRVALTSATTTLTANPYTGTVVNVASGGTETHAEVGVPLIPVTASYFYWAQFKGLCNVLIDGTPAIGSSLMRGSVAGSLAVVGASGTFKPIATAHHTGVNTEYRPVILDIP